MRRLAAMPSSVLVVDDDPGFRALATMTMRSWGFSVIAEAGTVAEALEQVDALRPEAALVDVGLPDGDGFELAERLVGLPWRPRVVLISSDADRANEAIAHGVGAAGFVPKDELLGERLQRLIGG
jgi:CheY-like chemotaxis protein